jgi:hypothetical protein
VLAPLPPLPVVPLPPGALELVPPEDALDPAVPSRSSPDDASSLEHPLETRTRAHENHAHFIGLSSSLG